MPATPDEHGVVTTSVDPEVARRMRARTQAVSDAACELVVALIEVLEFCEKTLGRLDQGVPPGTVTYDAIGGGSEGLRRDVHLVIRQFERVEQLARGEGVRILERECGLSVKEIAGMFGVSGQMARRLERIADADAP